MKEMNRRAFLKLSGASAALLALAACGGGSSAPAAPATPKDAECWKHSTSTVESCPRLRWIAA
ncbi:MAG: twin-arginine translocation signal domain-containing protein [Faecalibacterium prausnitzii]